MLFSQYLITPPRERPPRLRPGQRPTRDTTPGDRSAQTGDPLDLAISGSGFFSVETPLGTRYTRNGHFVLDPQGEVVTGDGYPVLGAGDQPLAVPTDTPVSPWPRTARSAAVDGQVGRQPDRPSPTRRLCGTPGVTPGANGLWVTDQTPQPATATVQQGMLEDSNVQPVVELTRMMAVVRASANVKNFLDEEDQRRSNAIERLGKVS